MDSPTINDVPTINDIPYEVFVNFILPLITIKDIGSLSMISPVWRDMCSEQEIWKTLYLQTVPYSITDDSVHVGPNPLYHTANDHGGMSWMSWRDIAHRRARMYIYTSSPHVINIPCIPNELRKTLKGWSEIRTDGGQSDHFDNFYNVPTNINDNQQARIDVYLNYVENEWLHYNKKRGLSVYNLCQCGNHYKFETLKVQGQCRKYKDFKKVTLKKLLTQAKGENKRRAKIVLKKEKTYKKYRDYMTTLEDELHEARIQEQKSNTLFKNLELAIK